MFNEGEDREALARILDQHDPEGGVWREDIEGYPDLSWWYPQVDAILAAGFHRTPAPVSDVQALIDEARIYSNAYWPRESRGDINPSRMPGDNPNLARVLDRLAAALEVYAPYDTEWEYGTVVAAFGGEPEVASTLECAQHVRENSTTFYRMWTHGSEVTVYRRRKSGPWEPLPAEAADA